MSAADIGPVFTFATRPAGSTPATSAALAHLGPAAYPLSPVIGLTALGRALRRLGAAADVGAAVEAAVAAWDDGD